MLETLSAEGDKYIAFLSPAVAMVMVNRLESGDPVRGQCSQWMLCALLLGPPPVMQGCSSLAALQ